MKLTAEDKKMNDNKMNDMACLDKAVSIIKLYLECGTPREIMPMRKVSELAKLFLEKEYYIETKAD